MEGGVRPGEHRQAAAPGLSEVGGGSDQVNTARQQRQSCQRWRGGVRPGEHRQTAAPGLSEVEGGVRPGEHRQAAAPGLSEVGGGVRPGEHRQTAAPGLSEVEGGGSDQVNTARQQRQGCQRWRGGGQTR